ncbi:AAA family ATPase [Kocuria sediminis]|uniref:AAA family ATPase n=1 Tax=Kocuria sediminis TaxID=1038857 RepID=A0A6N8GK06_9MICC|nr:AAA family ATPase [Kocuria sediminis]
MNDLHERLPAELEQYQPEEQERSTWARIDLSSVLDGTFVAPEPELMARTDGHCLLYPGKVHSFQGESESGKSMLAQAEAARAIQDGGHVLYLDFESDQATVVGRLLLMGCAPGQILMQFDYRRPDAPLGDAAAAAEWAELTRTPYMLAVIDGVTEAFSVQGVNSLDNDEVTKWGRAVPRRLAERTGAAVVVVDHVTKNRETAGRFAIGAQAKMSYLTGASYGVEVTEPLGVGMRGVLSIRIGKDRPGRVRPQSGKFRKSDRTQEAAVAVIDSTDPECIEYTLEPPQDGQESDGKGSEGFRPTALMERVSRAFEDAGRPLTSKAVRAVVIGKAAYVTQATQILEAEGYIRRPSPNAPLVLIRSYRETDEMEGTP